MNFIIQIKYTFLWSKNLKKEMTCSILTPILISSEIFLCYLFIESWKFDFLVKENLFI